MVNNICRDEGRRSLELMASVTVLGIVMLSCICIGCGGGAYPRPTPGFPIEHLLLDESVFPEGWRADEPFDPEVRLPAEQIVLFFHRNECPFYVLGAGHEIYRFFDGAESAAQGYPEESTIWFYREDGWGPWTVPPELPYQSPVADQFRFACSAEERSGDMTCRALGQYEEYIVLFDVEMNPEYPDCMSFTDLERILVAIDERMASYMEEDSE